MTLGLDESLEDYEEKCQLNYKRARHTLDPEPLKLVLLRGIREDILEILNMMSRGEIYQIPYNNIKNVFKNHSRAARKKDRASQDLSSFSSSTTSIKSEVGNILEDLKSEMMHTFSLQMETM